MAESYKAYEKGVRKNYEKKWKNIQTVVGGVSCLVYADCSSAGGRNRDRVYTYG